MINRVNKTVWKNQTRWKDIERIIWKNQTRWINKTNIINVKKIIERIKWINRTRWFNKTRWFNQTRWINQTNIINKTRWTNKTRWIDKNNESFALIKKVSEKENENENKYSFTINYGNIFVLGGLSIGGLIIMSMTFYVSWKCWLKEKIEDIIITYLIGEDGKSCLEKITCLKEYYGYLTDIKEKSYDENEYYGLTPQQIAVCKEAKAINKIKYEEALKIRWNEIAKYGKRPDDSYHKALFKQVLKPKTIEMTELHNKDDEEKSNIIKMEEGNNILYEYEIKPGTPRRRRKSVAI